MNYYKFEDLDIGMSFEFKEVVTEEKMALFLKLSGDNNTLHCDEEYAKRSNMEGRVVYGMLSSSWSIFTRGKLSSTRNKNKF